MRHQIRVAAAETLFIVTADAELKEVEWSKAVKDLKDIISGTRSRVLHTG